jgi:tetratricopeptide (TPR) repeat protein
MPPALLSDYASDSGRWAEHAGFEAAAAFSYELSLELAPNSFAAGKVTRSLLLEQQVEQAISVWDQMAVDLPREDPGHWLAVAEAAELEQDWEQVAIAYGRGAQIAEAPYRFWVAQGRALQHLDDWEDARQAYGRAFLLDVPRISPLKALGELGLQQDRYLEAARWFWMALQLRPDDVLSNYHMAQVLHGVGEHRSAVPFLARAVELHSGQPWEWLVELGDWQMALGDSAGALEAYHRALNWQPEETSIEERIEQVTGEGNQ